MKVRSLISHRFPFDQVLDALGVAGTPTSAKVMVNFDGTAQVSAANDGKPPLAGLVLAGDQQKEAQAITDFIFMAKDISNAYLVTTAAGDVHGQHRVHGQRAAHQGSAGAASHRAAALHHPHAGACRSLRRRAGNAASPRRRSSRERRFVDTWQYFNKLAPYLGRRSRKLWGTTIKRAANPPPPPEVVPDITVDRRYAFDLGGRRFEVISTPGGETLDSLVVWMPQGAGGLHRQSVRPGVSVHAEPVHRCAATSRARCSAISARSTRVRRLGAEMLITGHGEPIRGAAKIRADLDQMHAAVSYVNDATIAA